MTDPAASIPTTAASQRERSLAGSLLLFVTVLYSLAVRPDQATSAVAVVVATAALVAALVGRVRQPLSPSTMAPEDERAWELRLMLAVVLLGLLGALGWSSSLIGPSSSALERLPSLIWILLAINLFLFHRKAWLTIGAVTVATTVAITLIVGALHIAATGGAGFDVLFLHKEAAQALAEGANPYTEVVQVPDGAPTAPPGAVITGYVYPLVTAVAYSVGEWTLSDPRYTSLVAWATVLGLVGAYAVRTRQTSGMYVMLLLAAIPGWPLVLRAAWTEPLNLALLTAAFLLWRSPTGSGSGMGLALASKQYFLVAAPLLLFHRDLGWRPRLVVAAAIVSITLGVALAWDAGAFWSAAIEFHTTTPVRLDSSNLVGLLGLLGVVWYPPTILTLGAGLAAAVIAGRVSRDRQTFMMALALTLAATFLVSSQAFANYWFLLAGLCGLALVDTRPNGPGQV